MDTLQRKPHLLFSIGFILICLIGLTDLLTAISFFVHVPLAKWHLPASVILTLILNFYYTGYFKITDKWAYFIKTSVCLLLVLLLSIFIAGKFYDLSFDGQQYHQEGVYQLGHNHWDPYYEVLPQYVNQSVWVNCYPKQVEACAAAVYAFTGNIETGKAFNFILLIASFCLTFSWLKQYTTLKPVKVLLLALLFAFNPITVAQLFTYMVDGQMASLILCLFIIILYLYQDTSWDKLLLFIFITIIFINVKFTTIVFAGIFIIFLLLMLFLKKNMKAFWRVFISGAIGTFFAVIIVGFNPFVTNIVQHQNVFYPIFGKNKIDIIVLNTTPGFQQKNRFEKLFITTFSHTDNIDSRVKDRLPQLKIPFTLNKLDIKSLSYPDNRIGGFGPFFSGIFLLSIAMVIILLIYYRQAFLKNYLAAFLIMLAFSIGIFEEAWWARYIPQFWFIPVVLLIIIDLSEKKWVILLTNLTYVVMFLNIGLYLYMITQTNVLKAAELNYQMAQFKALNQPINIDFHGFDANRVRLAEHQIPYIEKHINDTTAIKVIFSHARVKTDKALPALPLPWLLKMENKLKGK